VTVDAAHARPSVDVMASSFRPAPTTHFTVLAWLPVENRFHDDFLMFPSERLVEFAEEQNGHYIFQFRPGSVTRGRLKGYRRHLGELRTMTEDLLVVE